MISLINSNHRLKSTSRRISATLAFVNGFKKYSSIPTSKHLFNCSCESENNNQLASKTDLEGCLIPKAGQHRCGDIPRFV